MDKDTLLEIRQKLVGFESMTWHEILVRGKKRNHSIPLNQLERKAQKRLEDLRLEDRDDLISLRLAGRQRIWGFRQGPVLSLLWWDPEHLVCPARKKHT
jgi:ABC-type arginine transport system ATPase subunit